MHNGIHKQEHQVHKIHIVFLRNYCHFNCNKIPIEKPVVQITTECQRLLIYLVSQTTTIDSIMKDQENTIILSPCIWELLSTKVVQSIHVRLYKRGKTLNTIMSCCRVEQIQSKSFQTPLRI